MTTPKRTLPFVLILGMTAGSGAVYAQDLDADVTTGPSAICAEGDTDCLTESEAPVATFDNDGADDDADTRSDLAPETGADTGTESAADMDEAVTAESDGSLTPAEGDAAGSDDGRLLNGLHSLASTQDLVGVNVYDAEDNRVGEISAVLPADTDNAEERVVIGMGGFLGFGQKPVAIPASALQVEVDADGDIERVVTRFTQAELDEMPEADM